MFQNFFIDKMIQVNIIENLEKIALMKISENRMPKQYAVSLECRVYSIFIYYYNMFII